jgi:hypothetical protein
LKRLLRIRVSHKQVVDVLEKLQDTKHAVVDITKA